MLRSNFTVDKICGPEYPLVTIKTCGTDFPVNTVVKLRNIDNTTWTDLDGTRITETACSTGNGQVLEVSDLIDDGIFSPTAFKIPFEFLIEVQAQNINADGNFKTEVQINEDYRYLNGYIAGVADYISCNQPASCCRKAVNGEVQSITDLNESPTLQLIPNPANRLVRIASTGLSQNANITIMDALGRTVKQTIYEPNVEIDISQLPKGIYQVRVRDDVHSVVQTLVVQ